ncbi:winged helix-turn-helix domain-containing protein [Parasalinivibrio latis]|uniref:transcriptional regulator n=1 Tax=Parasalinivibrio latis TaxID=2952610 RepID=UPI0030E34466
MKQSKKILIGERFVFCPNDSSLVDLLENNEQVRLGSNECRVLMVLLEEPHAIVPRNRIHDYVWREQGFEVDDSSLTQSISTLRKALKDSTKSPEFVKTVPKRGYQIIASIEDYDETKEAALPLPEVAVSTDETHPVALNGNTMDSVETTADNSLLNVVETGTRNNAVTSKVEVSKQVHVKSLSFPAIFCLVLAVLIPLFLFIFTAQKSETFRHLTTVKGVEVMIPENNPSVANWQPMIERCVTQYADKYLKSRNLQEVIVTGGQKNQLALNYIHDAAHADLNITYSLLTNQEDSSNLCN